MFKLLDKCLELSYESVLLSEVVYFNRNVKSMRDMHVNISTNYYVTVYNILYKKPHIKKPDRASSYRCTLKLKTFNSIFYTYLANYLKLYINCHGIDDIDNIRIPLYINSHMYKLVTSMICNNLRCL